LSFYPIQTEDGTVSLYNIDVNDVYHSKVGAYTEALNKYVFPSGILEFARTNHQLDILDVCYGLGYNSRTAVNEVLKVNPEINVNITAVEIDPVVLAFSIIFGSECFNDDLNVVFFREISKQVDIQKTIKYHINNTANISPDIKNKITEKYKLIHPDAVEAKLHNIYYRSISTRNSIDIESNCSKVFVELLINDARTVFQNLNKNFDFIFHDPFTPSKTPVLWTVEFFKLLYKHLRDTGNVTTYSSAAPVRAGMIEAGFFVGQTKPIGKKTSGTIAYKNPELVKNKLSVKESGLLETKAGIPYMDETLDKTNEEILKHREFAQMNSNRISSGRFLKSLKK